MKSLMFAAAALAVSATAPVQAVQPWSRPAVAGSTAAGYVTLVNHGSTAQTLTGVSSPLASAVEIHSSSMAGGVMRMAHEEKAVIPAGGRLAFAPGGWHLMLVGLKQPVKAGDRIPATLKFAGGRTLKVAFAVGDGLGPPAAKSMQH
jgi:copper(I)-binding protein